MHVHGCTYILRTSRINVCVAGKELRCLFFRSWLTTFNYVYMIQDCVTTCSVCALLEGEQLTC